MYHKNVKWFSTLLMLSLVALTGCYAGNRPPRIGEPAPDFALEDGNKTVALHDFKGDVVVLNFWATWCPPCVEEVPSLVEMQKELAPKGVKVFGVSVDVDQKAYEKFLKDYQIDFVTVRDPQKRTPGLYGTFGWPETYIIDRRGIVRRKFIGAVDWTQPDIKSYIEGL